MVKATRPCTATLIKPTLLDTTLLGIFDMTTVTRDHLLAIKNLVHTTPRCKRKPRQTPASLPDRHAVLNRTYRIRSDGKKLPETKEPAVPAPCVTCGRENQPERFHSHPTGKKEEKSETRKSIQKPIAVKFRSTKARSLDSPKIEPTKKMPEPVKLRALQTDNNLEVAQPRKMKLTSKWKEALKKTMQSKFADKKNEVETKTDENDENGYKLDTWAPAPISGGRKRKVVCYLCSQEFGTASLPAHEASCIQRFVNEKNQTDDSDKDVGKEELTKSSPQENWKLAWDVTQASLVRCDFCDRKFLPSRLETHLRVCPSRNNKDDTHKTSNQPGVLCDHCGKRYGSNSINIHREHCSKRSSEPTTDRPLRRPSAPPTIMCYICGRNFGTNSIRFHEPQCLRKWNADNDQMPSNMRRPSPIKAEDAHDDLKGDDDCSQEIFWKTHQAQLVPCDKCARTFYPDRLEVHKKGCKGLSKNKGK